MSAPELKKGDNGYWYIHWSENRRSKRVSTRQKDLATAKIFLGEWLLMGREAAAENMASTLTVADLWDAYYKQYVKLEVVGVETADRNWNNLKAKFGEKHLHEIDQALIDDYEADRAAGKIGKKSVSSTVRRELSILRACINFCAGVSTGKKNKKRKISKPLITLADIPSFVLPEDSDPRDRWHTQEEMDKLHAAARAIRRGKRMSRGERFLWLALETGARAGAIMDLTWERVDFETDMVHYKVPGQRETKKRRTSVPMSAPLRTVMLQAYAERLDPATDTGLVMDNKAKIWKTVQRIAKHAGVAKTFPNAMRHTAGTQMARNDVPLWKIAKVLANSVEMVEKVYAKHAPEDLRESVGAISAAGRRKKKPTAQEALEKLLRETPQDEIDAIFARLKAAE